jgi:hypothetical protein
MSKFDVIWEGNIKHSFRRGTKVNYEIIVSYARLEVQTLINLCKYFHGMGPDTGYNRVFESKHSFKKEPKVRKIRFLSSYDTNLTWVWFCVSLNKGKISLKYNYQPQDQNLFNYM